MSPTRRALAWGVHAYTACGLPLALLATVALFNDHIEGFFLALCAAVFVDATDGAMARAIRVREVLPEFDGRKLDDLIDFTTFAFLPAAAIVRFGLFPEGWEAAAAIPLMASGYGFCQDRAKTDDSFVGFPSYWNIILLYLVVLRTDPWINLGVITALAVLVFVPIHYIYPTKTKLLRPVTIAGGAVWAALMVAVAIDVSAAWAPTIALLSLVYPAYYIVLSLIHDHQVRNA
jgi:phosphatidylcholine synthase